MSSDLCVTPHDPDRRALPSLRLCGGCRDRLERDLADLPGLWARLERALATVSSGGQRVSGSSSSPLPINLGVVEHRDQMRHDLVAWVRYVADERGMEYPANEVGAMARWLGRHVDWISARQEAAEECPPVMRELTGRARRLLEPDGSKRITVGPCPDPVDDEPCGGTLYATVRAEGDARPSVIYCSGPCGSERGAETWMRFGRTYLREGRMAG